MRIHGDEDLPSGDGQGGADPEGDPGQELEARMESADRPYGAESYGTTAREEAEGEPLDLRLREEAPDQPLDDVGIAIEGDAGAPDDEAELIAEATIERDPFLAPEEAAMRIRDKAPGGVDDE